MKTSRSSTDLQLEDSTLELHGCRSGVTPLRSPGLHLPSSGQSLALPLSPHTRLHEDLQHTAYNNRFLKMQKANWRKPSVVHYIHHAHVNHCHAKECLYPLTAGISSGKSLSSALITTVLPIICWPRKTLSFTVWTILKQEFLLFPLISPVSCSSLLLALSAQCFEHYLHADRRERHCPFPLTSIQIKFLVLQTTRNFL